MPVTALFLDIGGVLLTDGWDHQARKLAARTFDLDLDEMEDRHHLTFDTYEAGKFKLDRFVDFFISSCFVHFRKPDEDIYRMALDIAQVPAGQVVYIEDRPMFVQVAEALGIRGIHHTDYTSTCAKLNTVQLRRQNAGTDSQFPKAGNWCQSRFCLTEQYWR